ncbi:hypothetical protein [Nostoc sp.]|uniref:hypothetical protein n=1 Tax=Nostoc sp. TaxID=1180 RepID=UPI002FF922A3
MSNNSGGSFTFTAVYSSFYLGFQPLFILNLVVNLLPLSSLSSNSGKNGRTGNIQEKVGKVGKV